MPLLPRLAGAYDKDRTRNLKDKWMIEELYDTKESNLQVKGLQVPPHPVTGLQPSSNNPVIEQY